MTKVFKTIQSTILALFSIKLFKIIKNYNSRAENIALVFPDFPRDFIKYFYSDAFINDVAVVNALAELCIPFKISTNREVIKSVKSKNIYLNLGNRFRRDNQDNYSEALLNYIKEIEQNNVCFPSYYETLWWENKAYMHERFEELNIKAPHSKIADLGNFSLNNISGFNFPFLIKEVHSAGSLGVYKVNNQEEVDFIINKIKSKGINKHVIIQELLSMDRDLRVIVIGDEIVLHYWRINKGKEWKPTSTKHGSGVDFEYFPNEWRQHILSEFKKMGLATGAFDLVWVDNDYSQSPYVLEISPSYQPNPSPPPDLKKSYGEFKTGFRLFDSYPNRFIKTVNTQKYKLILSSLKQVS